MSAAPAVRPHIRTGRGGRVRAGGGETRTAMTGSRRGSPAGRGLVGARRMAGAFMRRSRGAFLRIRAKGLRACASWKGLTRAREGICGAAKCHAHSELADRAARRGSNFHQPAKGQQIVHAGGVADSAHGHLYLRGFGRQGPSDLLRTLDDPARDEVGGLLGPRRALVSDDLLRREVAPPMGGAPRPHQVPKGGPCPRCGQGRDHQQRRHRETEAQHAAVRESGLRWQTGREGRRRGEQDAQRRARQTPPRYPTTRRGFSWRTALTPRHPAGGGRRRHT
jgi:hypothetical protein